MAKPRTASTTNAATPHAQVAQITAAADQPMGAVDLGPAIAVFNGMIAHQWQGRFPADLDAPSVHAHLLAHLAFERQRAAHGSLSRAERDALRVTEADTQAALKRLGRLVNAYHPRGSAGRAAFFATGEGDHLLARRLTAMIHGIETKGIPALPTELSVDALQGLIKKLPSIAVEATVGGIKPGAITMTREQLVARTKIIRHRLSALAEGLLGGDSAALADFGITPKVARRKRAATKGAATPTGDGTTSTVGGTTTTK